MVHDTFASEERERLLETRGRKPVIVATEMVESYARGGELSSNSFNTRPGEEKTGEAQVIESDDGSQWYSEDEHAQEDECKQAEGNMVPSEG